MKWLTDPRLFSDIMAVLSLASGIRWAIAGNTAQAVYWILACGITFTVTHLF